MTVKMPEPMKYLYRVKGFDGVNTVLVENIDGRAVLETFHLITTEQAEAYARAVRDEALEEAAQVCEEYEKKVNNSRADNRAQHFMGAMIGASACAAAIRAMKEQS